MATLEEWQTMPSNSLDELLQSKNSQITKIEGVPTNLQFTEDPFGVGRLRDFTMIFQLGDTSCTYKPDKFRNRRVSEEAALAVQNAVNENQQITVGGVYWPAITGPGGRPSKMEAYYLKIGEYEKLGI